MLCNNRAAENATKHRKYMSVLEIFWILSNLCVCLVTFWVDTSLQGVWMSRVSPDSWFSRNVDIFLKLDPPWRQGREATNSFGIGSDTNYPHESQSDGPFITSTSSNAITDTFWGPKSRSTSGVIARHIFPKMLPSKVNPLFESKI